MWGGGVGWKELKLAEQQILNIDGAAERHEYLTYANNSTLNLKAFQQQTILEFELWEFHGETHAISLEIMSLSGFYLISEFRRGYTL